jgi:Tol biopolymer transport system component
VVVVGLAGVAPLLVMGASSASLSAVGQVDVTSGEVPAAGSSSDPAMSSDGRYVVFTSDASNLVSGDTNGVTDVFIRDRTAGTTRIVSRAGASANGASYDGSVSDNGRFVVFTSDATNLAGGVAGPDSFLRDMTTGSVTRLGNGVGEARLSANGRYVAYFSGGRTVRYDRTTGGTVAVNEGGHPEISGSGRYVVTYLIDEFDQPSYLFTDLSAGTTRDLLAPAKALPGWNWDDYPGYPVISTNGRYVGFHTDASGIVPSDDVEDDDIYLVDTANGRYHRLTAELSDELVVSTPTEPGDFDFAISGNGRVVSFAIFDQTVTEYGQLVTLDRVSGLVSLVADTLGPFSAGLDATGSRVAYQDENGAILAGNVAQCTINGTGGNDTLVGTTGADVICGRGGNDSVEGRGDDDILANHRDNRLRGMGGNDEIVGHAGNDSMVGGGGTDSCDGEDGTDTASTCEDVDDVP